MKIFIKENWYKVLGIILLLIALGNRSDQYYYYLRLIIMIIGGCSAYWFYEPSLEVSADKIRYINWVWIFSIMAILFNPIFPFYFSRNTWQTLDVITAIVIFVNIVNFNKIKK